MNGETVVKTVVGLDEISEDEWDNSPECATIHTAIICANLAASIRAMDEKPGWVRFIENLEEIGRQ